MISDQEKKRYVLKEPRDSKILNIIHQLEKSSLSSDERVLLLLIRTQLEDNWRKPLLQILKLMKRHSSLNTKERMKKLKEFADAYFWKP